VPLDAPSDASSAPTIRPPPGPASSSSLAVSADRRGTGFTSVIRHLSLRGWLRWIHSNQCDATLRVRARDGGNGIIWCSAGTIVDAEWGSVVAEGAVQQMLRLGSGSVSIDFDPVDRAPRVTRPTHELLHPLQAGAVLGESRRATERHWNPSMQEPAFRPALTSPPDSAPADIEVEGGAERPRFQWQQRLRWRHLSRGGYLLGGISFAALMLLAFIFGRSRGAHDSEFMVVGPPEPERAQQTRSGLLPPPAVAAPSAAPPAAAPPAAAQPASPPLASPAARARELPVIPFATIEVEPAQSEIWLDQSLVGVGRIELAALHDGALHELRFVAPGHVPRSLYFMEQPPAGRIILARAGEPAASDAFDLAAGHEDEAGVALRSGQAEAAPAPARAAPRERDLARSVPRRRAPPRPAPEPAAAAKAAPVKKSPQIQLIDARVPRVQVLE
jgi:hypothetical protein